MTDDAKTDPLPIPIAPADRLLTAAEFQNLADVRPEVEWFANLSNPNTRRAYEAAVKGFTSKRGISDYVKEPEVCFGAVAKNLFALLPESNCWLNPLSECQKPPPPSEVALLLNGKIFDVVKAAN